MVESRASFKGSYLGGTKSKKGAYSVPREIFLIRQFGINITKEGATSG